MNNKQLCVLIATEIMDIGGAETHIYELCRALKSKGVRPVVVSSGGILAEALKEQGFAVYDVALRSKNPLRLLKSYKKILDIIKKEGCNVLHAHSRLPALLLHYAAKQKKLPFTVTDHAKFENSSILTKLLSRWGDKTLAVSEDLKEYLLDNYKNVKEQNIFLTINGIDTQTFQNRCDDKEFCSMVCNEFNLPQNKKIVLSVSRLDSTAYLCVYELLEIAPALANSNNDAIIVIVGGGELYEDVLNKAKQINQKIGREFVYLTGPTKEVYKLCAVCDVFVGCARSALEAIACEQPALIAGNGGYLGLACKQNLDFCLSSNFTARGINEFNLEKLTKDINEVLQNKDSFLENSKGMKGVIQQHYSVEKMAEDCIDVYYRAMQVPKGSFDCTITGYYGHGNMGDDTMLSAVVANLRQQMPGLKICALCRRDKQLAKALSKLDICIKRRFNPLSIYSAIKKSNALIFGGGTLIQDNTSTKSILYYLMLLKIAASMKKKTILYANGIGPINKEKNLVKAKKCLSKCTLITVRDKQSYDFLRQCGMDSDKIMLTADEAMTLALPDEQSCENILQKYGLTDSKYILISLRKWKKSPEGFEQTVTKAIEDICQSLTLEPVFLVMEKKHDRELTVSVAANFENSKIIYHSFFPDEFLAIIKKSQMVLSMRLHTLIFSGLCYKKMLGISYDPKVSAFLSSIGLEEACLEIENVTWHKLSESVKHQYAVQDPETYKDFIEQSKQSAFCNVTQAVKVLQ